MSVRSLGLLALLIAFLTANLACAPADGATRYPLKGKIEGVDILDRELLIAHEDIPGFMPAMTMPLKMPESTGFLARFQGMPLERLRRGDVITATLVVKANESFVEKVNVVRYEPPPGMSIPVPKEARLGESVVDVLLEDQDGKPLRISDYRGHVLVLTFIYTRCPIPEFCPRIMKNFQELENAIEADPDLRASARLLSVSFDVEFDRPEVLQAFGSAFVKDRGQGPFARWKLATGTTSRTRWSPWSSAPTGSSSRSSPETTGSSPKPMPRCGRQWARSGSSGRPRACLLVRPQRHQGIDGGGTKCGSQAGDETGDHEREQDAPTATGSVTWVSNRYPDNTLVKAPLSQAFATSTPGALLHGLTRSTLEARAGRMPKKSPVRIETTRVKPRIPKSTPISLVRVVKRETNRVSSPRVETAKTRPTPPPATAISELSVRSWHVRRPRVAPRAPRTASSRSRRSTRASVRFATFAQAINRTRPVVPRRIKSLGRAFWVSCSRTAKSCAVKPEPSR